MQPYPAAHWLPLVQVLVSVPGPALRHEVPPSLSRLSRSHACPAGQPACGESEQGPSPAEASACPSDCPPLASTPPVNPSLPPHAGAARSATTMSKRDGRAGCMGISHFFGGPGDPSRSYVTEHA